jgi:two-component system response regulator HydG
VPDWQETDSVSADSPQAPLQIAQLIESLPEPRIAVDLDYRIVAANAAYRAAYATERVVGRYCYEVSHQYSAPCHEAGESCPRERALRSGLTEKTLHIHHTPRGEEHVLVELSPVKDTGGRIGYFLERMRALPTRRDPVVGQELVGEAPAFMRMLDLVARVATSETTALLLGETGTGKEIVARAIHGMSPRQGGPFVVVECTGLTETLFESEMFGHEKGSFTGANSRTAGLIEAASGGTLFLDEIGDVSPVQQVKLLRLIETGHYRRVGGVEPLRSDVRLVAATNRDLGAMVREGNFRADLFYRINAFPVLLPPLRERREDLVALSESLLKRVSPNRTLSLAPDALQAMQRYSFPGNVRELRNLLERASLLTDSDVISARHLPGEVTGDGDEPAGMRPGIDCAPAGALRPTMERLAELVEAHDGDRRSLAKKLGISERTLYRRLRESRETRADA